MFWTIAVLVGLALIIGGFLTGHWFFGIISGFVTLYILGKGLNTKIKSFTILGILGSAVMIGTFIFGIQIRHPFIIGILGLAVNIGLFLHMRKKIPLIQAAAAAKATEEEKQKQAAVREALETRIAAGDEAAKRELIELGTDYTSYFPYYNFDYDEKALQRVYDLTSVAMAAKGLPLFDMGEVKEMAVGQSNPVHWYTWEGKTPRGDTVFMRYRIGKVKPGDIDYKLHLKALPEEVQVIGSMVYEEMQKFLSSLTQWNPQMDEVANNYQSGNNYSSSDNISNDNISKEKSGVIRVFSGSDDYSVAYRIDGNKIYSGSDGYSVAYRIDGK
jgi:hypothetical protein